MIRVVAAAILTLLLVALSGSAIAMRWAWEGLNEPYKGYPEPERVIVIEPGTGGRQIIDRLAGEGVIRQAILSRLYLRLARPNESLKAGEYRFREASTPLEVIDKLIHGRVLTHKVTILEGLTLEETARHLADSGFGQFEDFLVSMRSPKLIADVDPDARDLEGYLFPDTYAFVSGTSEQEIVRVIVSHCRRQLERFVLPTARSDSSRSLREIVILASIVEKEALVDAERPIIAGVYSNRLDRRMGLYADPTVIYALKKSGSWDGNIRRPDLKVDSPYNTYRYPGLPPGPIGSPGRASLEAAAKPADVPFLYFVSRNDGTHAFAKTLAEHNRNVYLWQKKYWRDQWARER
jgi:UPF0755 protein